MNQFSGTAMRGFIAISLLVAVSGLYSHESSRVSNGFDTSIEFSCGNDTLSSEGETVVLHLGRILEGSRYKQIAVILRDGTGMAELYLKNILGNQNVNSDFWLLKVNASGASGVLARTSTDSEKFHELLKASKTRSRIGYEDGDAGVAIFLGILKAIRALPRDSAILVFANGKVVDEELGNLVLNEITAKNVKLFTVWQGLHPTLSGEEESLKELTALSRGQFVIGNYERLLCMDYLQNPNNTKIESVVAHMENLHGRNMFDIPVDTGVTAIRINLSRDINTAQFLSPNGYLVNLLNSQSVESFSRGSYAIRADGVNEIRLDTAQKAPASTVGMWRLQIDADVAAAQGYNFTVFIQNNLVLTTERIALNKNQDKSYLVRLGLKGPFNTINNVTLKNKQGLPIQSNFEYKLIGDETDDTTEIETTKNKEISVNLNETEDAYYIEINGTDIYGNKFVRLNYVSPSITNRALQPITVETSLGSQLELFPNQRATIYFEVTNNIPSTVYARFICRDFKSILYRMSTFGATIHPYGTIRVAVTIIAGYTTGEDLITFSANTNLGQFQKSVIVHVEYNQIRDSRRPSLWYSYPEDCTKVFFGRCEDGYWTVEVTAQDRDSGLRMVTSNPARLYFPHGYVTGTKETVIGYYTGSCCQPEIEVTAIDVKNNRISYNRNAYYTAQGIGIIIGIILAILLVIALVVLCICKCGKCGKCTRKQKASVDLPTTSYRGPANSASTRRY